MNDGNHRTTERILDIMETVAEKNKEGLSFSDISRKLEIPKGSLSPLLSTLCNRGYLHFNSKTQKYYIGEALYSLGRCYVDDSNILNTINKVMKELSLETRATSFLGVLSGNEVSYLLKNNAPINLQVTAVPGNRLPAYCTGLGKAMIAEKEREELIAMYPDGLHSITPYTITDIDRLYRQLLEVRKTGFSYESQESSLFIQCFARPLRVNQKTIAALSIAFPIGINSQEELARMKESLSENVVLIEDIISKHADKWIYSCL